MNAHPARDPNAPSAGSDERRALLSALADGEAAAVDAGCALWRDDAEARATWHTYHLIGDALRSEELAGRPARDAAFLAALRRRLADEPVVLAPAPLRRHQLWLRRAAMPAAVAAGFVAVAGVLVVARLQSPEAGAPQVVVAKAPGAGLRQAADGTVAPAAPLVIDGRLVRDAQLDAYLRAHRDAVGGAPAAMPGGVPRNIEALAPAGPVATSVER